MPSIQTKAILNLFPVSLPERTVQYQYGGTQIILTHRIESPQDSVPSTTNPKLEDLLAVPLAACTGPGSVGSWFSRSLLNYTSALGTLTEYTEKIIEDTYAYCQSNKYRYKPTYQTLKAAMRLAIYRKRVKDVLYRRSILTDPHQNASQLGRSLYQKWSLNPRYTFLPFYTSEVRQIKPDTESLTGVPLTVERGAFDSHYLYFNQFSHPVAATLHKSCEKAPSVYAFFQHESKYFISLIYHFKEDLPLFWKVVNEYKSLAPGFSWNFNRDSELQVGI